MKDSTTTLPIFYETPGKPPSGGFLSDVAYKDARICLPFIGTDAFIVNRDRKSFRLPYRKATPAQGYWGIGGGLKTGVTPLQAMMRAFKRETSLELPNERFIERADLINAVMWSTEEIMNFHIPFFVELTEEEIAVVETNLDPNEYEGSKGIMDLTLEELDVAHRNGDVSDGAIDVLRLYYSGVFN